MSTFNFKIFSGGYTPGPPLKGEGKRRGGKGGEAPPPIHIPGYAAGVQHHVTNTNACGRVQCIAGC